MKILEKNHEKSSGPRARQRGLELDTKSMIHKRKTWLTTLHQNWTLAKLCSAKGPVKMMKKQLHTGRKYFQTTYPAND